MPEIADAQNVQYLQNSLSVAGVMTDGGKDCVYEFSKGQIQEK